MPLILEPVDWYCYRCLAAHRVTMEPGEFEIWEPILADPLDRPPSSATIPPMSQVQDYFYSVYGDDAMEIQIHQLIEEPRDEQCGDQYLGGALNPPAHLSEKSLSSEFIPKDCRRRAPRGPRKRRIFPLKPPCLGSMPFACGGRKGRGRKNNDHWTDEEVTKLVDGVSSYGVGRWTKVKTHYFSTSVRKAVHLKDKWRNLLIACGVKCTYKKKNAQKVMLRPLDTKLIKRIQALAS